MFGAPTKRFHDISCTNEYFVAEQHTQWCVQGPGVSSVFLLQLSSDFLQLRSRVFCLETVFIHASCFLSVFFWNNLSELGGNELASPPPHPPAATQNFRSTGAGEENLRLSDARARRTRVRGSLSVKWPLSLRKSVSQDVMTRARVPAALQLELG